jgi:hypothetical protein
VTENQPLGYRAVERFDSSWEGWKKYIQGSKLVQLREVVSLDGSLNPCILDDLSHEDWRHVVYEEQLFGTFDSLEYALIAAQTRGRQAQPAQLLAVILEPSPEDLVRLEVQSFELKGFDLLDTDGSTSALTNCGGFDDAFRPSELSDCGLLRDLDRAYAVRKNLAQLYPEEPHANCNVWAVWRAQERV